MSLLKLSSKLGRKKRKTVGRGNASGHGTYSTRGGKGQTARTGGTRRPGFEGGQTPFLRKMPKLKGFKNPNQITYQIINVEDLNVFENNATVDQAALLEKNIVSKKTVPVKLLGNGVLEKTINISVAKASAEAIKKVEALKGKVTTKAIRVPVKKMPKREPKKTVTE